MTESHPTPTDGSVEEPTSVDHEAAPPHEPPQADSAGVSAEAPSDAPADAPNNAPGEAPSDAVAPEETAVVEETPSVADSSLPDDGAGTEEATSVEPPTAVEATGLVVEEPAAAPAEESAAAPAEQASPVVEEPAAAPAEEASPVAEGPSPVEELAAEAPSPAEEASPVAEEATPDAEEPSPAADSPHVPTPHVPTPAEVVARPATPGAIPSPALFARSHAGPDLRQYGRVGEDGVVYVKTGESERAVGSYPGANAQGALSYFARKYDEIAAAAELLHQRVTQTDISAKDAEESFAKLRDQAHEPNAVGDLAALEARVAEIGVAVAARKAAEAEQRAAARAEGRTLREALVAEAEKIAGQSPERTQWKQSGARMRELLDTWKEHQKAGPRLDRTSETALWQRFSAARNSFDRARRVHFAHLDGEQSEAKSAKTRLVAEAERLAVSKDWAPTASAFKRLMDDWRQSGRAGRSDDDALWERFRAAQDSFFTAKDAVVAAEEEVFRGNLTIKEALLTEAESILPVTDLERAKTALRSIQDRWDKAGKVPRSDLERTEKALRRIEQGVRDVEEKKWSSSNPEAAARAQSFADQLESAVAGLRDDLAKAEASGNQKKIDQARAALEAREQWLAQARAGLEEFGG